MKKRFLLFFVLIGSLMVNGQHPLLQSGPMVGYSEMREVMLWVQTKSPAKVRIAYHEAGVTDPVFSTGESQTSAEHACAAHLLADKVMPGKIYEYTLYINGEEVKLPYECKFRSQTLWQYRTPAPDFKFATGSCVFINDEPYDRPGNPYGGNYEIFTTLHKQNPEFMLWLGDNTYLREADWNTRTGVQYRYTHTRSLPELQPLLANVHHYAIWDDHDYGPNDADRSFIHKDITLQTFRDFWGNPRYGLCEDCGITSQFSWSDCDFFLLDDRWFRAPNDRVTGERTMLGEQQLEWMLDALRASKATFKFVAIGGQVLSTADKYENYIHVFPAEREKILKAIQDEKIKGVIFLTGDRHQTELSKYEPQGGVPVYDLTCSPITSTAYDPLKETNDLRVEGTAVGVRNFALLEVAGPKGKRVVKITVKDTEGKILWMHEIPQP